MASGRLLLTIFTICTIFSFGISGSSIPSQYSLSTDSNDEVSCPDNWNTFRHLCWTHLPEALSFLDDDVTSVDLVCSQLGARALRVIGRLYCVKEAVRLSDDLELENLFDSVGKTMSKRLMGNNGY